MSSLARTLGFPGICSRSLFEAGLIAAGVNVGLLGPFPTPGVAFLTRNSNADLGVVISASHNPYQDNGFKFFDQNGRKLSDSQEARIADSMNLPITTVDAEELGRAKRPANTREQYIDVCKSTVNSRYGFNEHKDRNGLCQRSLLQSCANHFSRIWCRSLFDWYAPKRI